MSFDEQPDGDPHGECAAEIHRLETELATLKQQASRLDAAEKPVEGLVSALDLIIRRLQMDIDDGSRPDQWSMESLVRTAQEALAEAAKWREGKK